LALSELWVSPASAGSLLSLHFDSDDGSNMFLWNVGISQKCLRHIFLLISCLESEDGCSMFLRNIDWPSTDYTAFYPRK
jgi:hypothetical protein